MQLTERNHRKFEAADGGHLSPLEAARQWTEQGFFVVPVPDREKRPVIAGWQNLRLTIEDLPNHFGSAPQNIGLLLGEPYGNADVDLDCAEALKLWHTFAPPTKLVFGHQTKTFSHWLYRMDPPGPSLKFEDPIQSGETRTLLELRCLSNDRSVGRQTVAPPSRHKDTGELIRFEPACDGEPGNVDAEILIRAVHKTAAACVLARHYPPRGSGRHDTELALAGVLARARWTEQEAKEFVIGVYTAVPDHDRNALSRVAQAVEDSYRKYAEEVEITGIPRLSALIDKRAVDAALEWLGIEGGPAAVIDAGNWHNHLIKSDRGKILTCVENAMLALRHDRDMQGVLQFDENTLQTTIKVQPPWTSRPVPFVWRDEDDTLTAAWLQRLGIMVQPERAAQAVHAVAREHGFHPVRDYLESLKWDRISRIDDWLTLYLRADASDYTRAVGARWLISAVARIFRPGCKVDTCLILEGKQGALKSTALNVLGTPWFTDEIADIGSKDAAIGLRGKWIIELAELDAMQKSEISKIKAYMSRSVDHYRPPYGRHAVDVPRESVFAGTVNPDTYLKDETGNRRFWPVKCGRIDIETLKRDKDQLWSEAVVRYKNNAAWWLDTPELNALAQSEQEQRFDADPWQEKIQAYVEDHDHVTIDRVLGPDCIDKLTKDRTQADKNRVSRCLRVLGWQRKRSGTEGREWRYYPPAE